MKKIVLILPALLLLSCLLSGCGSKEAAPDGLKKQQESTKKRDEQNG